MEKLLDIDYLIKSYPHILKYLPVTIWISVASMVLGIAIGLATALIRLYKVPVLGPLSALYVSFVRGTPLLVQIYLVFYGIPKFIYYFQTQHGWMTGIDVNYVSPEVYVLLSFSFNLGAYLSETIRSAIESVDRGQFEAADAIGLSRTQTMLKIILPQALTVALPNLGNTFISTIKDTSLVFVIGVIDIMGEAKIIGARGLAYFEVFIAVSLIYWPVCIIIERVLVIVEKRIRKYERSAIS
ncbi:L-cystine transport system permease protein [Paenibacillus taihuensis]|uniref:L-cystine transport system permease protein n=1 Tax=Paenibacillus taihuensis TaxID=1156355 RepID=A0A3D9S1H5_9BACL|nr:amino acid ABC transporter permease [Paenibacillus taihuensis]REE86436.1 L-cystine transport system permease protein [Paenibacillus taihuensis]